MLFACGPALGQEPNLGDLQRKVDEAKNAQEQDKREAAKPPKPTPANQAPPNTRASPNAKPAAATYVVHGKDVLRNTVTGLLWTRSDNGSDINWNDAKAHCARSPGWRLPTVDELISLYDPKLPGVDCGRYTCKVAGQFQLTDSQFWSGDSDGPSKARSVTLGHGNRHSTDVDLSSATRALCVRRS
jgi:hypothetical protein